MNNQNVNDDNSFSIIHGFNDYLEDSQANIDHATELIREKWDEIYNLDDIINNPNLEDDLLDIPCDTPQKTPIYDPTNNVTL